MIGSKPCSCLGENSNCFRCDGSGYYELEEITGRSEFRNFASEKASVLEIKSAERLTTKKVSRLIKSGTFAGKPTYKTVEVELDVFESNLSRIEKQKHTHELTSKSHRAMHQIGRVDFKINRLNFGIRFKPMVSIFMDQFLKHHQTRNCKLIYLFKDHAVFDYNGVDVFLINKEALCLEIGASYEIILSQKHEVMQYEVVLSMRQIQQLKKYTPQQMNLNEDINQQNDNQQKKSIITIVYKMPSNQMF